MNDTKESSTTRLSGCSTTRLPGLSRSSQSGRPKYSVEHIAARTGKNPDYIAARLKLTELAPVVVEAFHREEIGVGHALLLAKLQLAQQEQALGACFKEEWSAGGQKPKRILLPVRSLQFWIESNILLVLKLAPFDKSDARLVPAAGSCVECHLRTGHNKLLFSELGKLDACTAPTCYQAKVDAHIAKSIAAKPKLVQISTAYRQQNEGSVLPRNKYTEIRTEKPATKEEAARPEFKTCKYTTEAIVSEGVDKGEIRKVCTEPTCPVHHSKPRAQKVADDGKWKAEQEKERREAAIANTTGLRILAAISAAVPVRLMKRDLLFVVERLAATLDERRLEVVAVLSIRVKARKSGADVEPTLRSISESRKCTGPDHRWRLRNWRFDGSALFSSGS